MSQVDEILNGPEYFYCEREHCRLRIEVCLKRQKANQERRRFMSIPFLSCVECDQGARNQPLEKTEMAMNPVRGKGERKLNCEHYDECLDLAAKKDWKTFKCENCPSFMPDEVKKEPKIAEKKKNTRICEKCGEKPTIQPSSPLCASCIGKQAWKDRGDKKKAPGPSKKKNETNDKVKIEKTQHGPKTALTIEFGRHTSILKEVEKLAEEEVRTIDLQVIYILKSYLNNCQANKNT